ncbi:MAG: hypothetical protein ISR71_03310, partial [Gammaproteobacteria bacterium]|nr:hypothetical protein [Gammaproteobacteria bacterium]
MVKRIWEQYSSLIQWSVVLLLVLLLLVIWMGGEDDNKVAEEIASVVEPLKPEVVVATAPEPAPE